ncbi:PspA/IM30 family protein [Roseibium sp. Sym1]|uniref:PspA/IM30 family protein n=1 Tax=Roseibium sp. Sym1 TaxID=3016006 RepID=UPI0022B2EE79|nr:PspA/IM30 family protein [Roseibium sp. Sym1]
MFEPFMTQLRTLLQGSFPAGDTRPSRAALAVNLREAAASVRAARIALARARAEQQQDRKRLQQIRASIEDLENRARNALLKGSEALAREAAEAIALLEDEKAALETATTAFDEDLAALTETLHRAQSRLRALKRGERSVDVRAHVLKAQSFDTGQGQSALAAAETCLEDIRHQQERDRLAEREYAALAVADRPEVLIEKLGDAGCGAPVKTRADDVLARLKSDLPCLLEANR